VVSINRTLLSGPRCLREIMLAEALCMTKVMARQEQMHMKIDGNAQFTHAGQGCQDPNEDWWNPGGICDEEGYAPACRCDEDPMDDTLHKDDGAWWRAGIHEQERCDPCSTPTTDGNSISPNSIAQSYRSVCKNDCKLEGHVAVLEDDSGDEEVHLQLTGWNPRGIVDADESYAPSCPCD